MESRGKIVPDKRLAQARELPDFVTYGENYPVGHKDAYRFSIHGLWASGEIFIEMTDGESTRVGSFISRHKNCPPEMRRKVMTLVDAADAYEYARQIAHCWRHRSIPPFTY